METRLRIIVNGTDHSFQREFGCDCGACRNPWFRANTSVSLVVVGADDRPLWHGLIDVGAGVVNNLADNFSRNRWQPRLDLLLLTHWHHDHVAGLNQLCEGVKRSARRRTDGALAFPIPTWCRSGTWDWLGQRMGYERNFLARVGIDADEPTQAPGQVLALLPTDDPALGLTIRPVSISHESADRDAADWNRPAECTAGFVVEHAGGGGHRKKAVVLWDLDYWNDWILSPGKQHEEALRLLKEADVLFVDCNTWRHEGKGPARREGGVGTGHASFETVKRYVGELTPRQTVLIHLSGHEDGEGHPGWGWSHSDWEAHARPEWPHGDVCVMDAGQTLAF